MSDPKPAAVRSVLRHLDVAALAADTKLESRARQRHLPPISVYRWWARRTETVTGAVIDAIGVDNPGRLLLADPFSGGGVIALAGLLRGHRVYAQDVNPWAAGSLVTMLSLPSPDQLDRGEERLHAAVADLLARAYSTTFSDDTPATISHTMRVATAPCPGCARTLRLFPSALVSLTHRVDCGGDAGYLACAAGHITLASAGKRTKCGECGRYVTPPARYTTGRTARCVECHWSGKLSELAGEEGFSWEVVLTERAEGNRRELGLPSTRELAAADSAEWEPRYDLPAIQPGVESAVLTHFGMHHWHDLYPARQRVVLEALLEGCEAAGDGDERLTRALKAAVFGSTEMSGFASRWDARYLKAYEAVANHRFNFTTFAAEPNVWGASEFGRGTVTRRLEHLAKAASWFEERIGRPLRVDGPKSSAARRSAVPVAFDARVVCGSSQRLCVPKGSLDAVVTDPPYHDDVHYAELSDLFRSWAGIATGVLDGDAIVRGRNGDHGTHAYRALLRDVFKEIRRALRPGGHLVLSYANRHPDAWVALFYALEEAGFSGVGYTVLLSENDADNDNVGRRACNLDVLIDLVPPTGGRVYRYQLEGKPANDEEAFCRLVGRQALRIGRLGANWAEGFTKELRSSPFIV